MKIANDEILAAPASLGTDFSSNAIFLGHVDRYAIQLIFTGSPNGSFKLQASNDIGEAQKNTEAGRGSTIVNWTDISGSTQNVNSAGDHMWSAEIAPYRWVRVVWERTAGTGSLESIRLNTKGY